jgi:ribosome-associated heat shock protein Hsp15
MRVDAWLDVACLYKTRSEAKRGCEGGKVEVNGEHAKPHRMLREGDRVRISRGLGRYQDVIVRILIDQHVKKAEARALYVTPKRRPRIEVRRAERVFRAPAARRIDRTAGARSAAPRKDRRPCRATRKSSGSEGAARAETAHGVAIDARRRTGRDDPIRRASSTTKDAEGRVRCAWKAS